MMRIITGSARGTKLDTLEGESTRPTAERTKQAIFNILQFDIEDRRVLDLFGGSGQLALEALSRGAASAFICENNNSAFEIIKSNAKKTKLFDRCRLVCTDYLSALRSLADKESFHLIFLDPPYQSDYLSVALRRIHEGSLLADGGYIVCESESAEPLTCPGTRLYRHAKYGRAYITILVKDVNSRAEGDDI